LLIEEELMSIYGRYLLIACVMAPWLMGAAQAQTPTQPPQPAPAASAQAGPASSRPNILVIWGDDIGTWNVGAYTHGMMGRTPHIDSLAQDGMLFTDHYGQPSCTAGRAAFITGQNPIRTGMTTVGIPGSTRGIQKEDPTLAEVLKSVGYNTAQFGKNRCMASTNGSVISIT
jgi:hypothetical protein